MKSKILIFFFQVLFSVLFLMGCNKQNEVKLLNDLILENETAFLKIELQGGMYTDFHLKNNPANPFTWEALPEQMPKNNRPYVFKGHFLCAGRWGTPSENEIEAGIPHNGEVNTQRWEITQAVSLENGIYTVEMSCKAPIEKLDVVRTIKFPEKGSYYIISEKFTNNLPVGKQSNFVQHPTIAAPFLSEKTIINTNATLGFDQKTPYDSLEIASFNWPNGKMADGSNIDLQTVTSEKGYVTSHIFPDDAGIGWITALNPERNLLFGYIWRTVEYPWLNVWHNFVDGKPFVQGLEFGTTGLGQPYKLLLENNVTFFGRNSFEFIEAGETKIKLFVCLQIEVPEDFDGVAKIEVKEDKIEILSRVNQLLTFKANLLNNF